MQKATYVKCFIAMLGAGLAGEVAASGFQLLEQNASGLGNAYAGSAVVGENASTVFYNPAAMTELVGKNVSIGFNTIKPSYRFKDGGSSDFPAATGSNGGDAGDWAYVPNFYSTWQLSDQWFIGLGVGAPFGLKTQYQDDWAGRFQSLEFEIKTTNVNPSVAYKVNDQLSIGAGFNYQRMEVRYQRDAAVVNAFTQSTVLTLDANSEAYGWNAGVTYKVSPTTDIGFSYRSKMFHHLGGTLASSNQAVSPDVLAKADITLPDTYILSVSQAVSERWEMLGDLSRTNWSSVDQIAILRNSGASSGSIAQILDARFRDTWRVALGGTYKINDAWKWKYGVAYDQSPVRSAEERLASLPDNNRYWFSTGAQWKMDKTTAADIGLTYLYIPDAHIQNNQSSAGRGSVVGDYEGSIFIFGVQLSKAF